MIIQTGSKWKLSDGWCLGITPENKTVYMGTETEVREMLLATHAKYSSRIREAWMWETSFLRKDKPVSIYSKITNPQDVITNLELHARQHPEDREWAEERMTFWRERKDTQ